MTSNNSKTLLPGSTIGVIGGGQLGRYFVIEARRLGYDTWVLDPSENSPAMQWSTHSIVAAYDDPKALAALAEHCSAVTTEFENVPATSLEWLSERVTVAPSAEVVTVAQDRRLEKGAAAEFEIPTAPYAVIETKADVDAALGLVQFPAILKTATLGYDGKGQQTCHSADDVMAAFVAVNEVPCVLEQRVALAAEISIVLARGFDGSIAVFPVAENVHTDGILDTTMVPARVDGDLQTQAIEIASTLAEGLDYHGVLALEFFITEDRELLFNEMAPRPHNSGHYTLDATVVSQFEQQVRTLCGLPLGETALVSAVCMLNLLGDSWGYKAPGSTSDAAPDFHAILDSNSAKLHLYGKADARPARKMGHINCLAPSVENAHANALEIRAALRP